MGIRSTVEVTRPEALERIDCVLQYVWDMDYRALEKDSFEEDGIKEFMEEVCDSGLNGADRTKWTNSMLEDLLDRPFFRWSMFQNYTVSDTGT